MVIGSLWLLTRYVLNDKSKKISVSHAKHWQIREICEIRVQNKNIRAIRSSCERTAANKDPKFVRSVCVLSQVVPCAKNYSCYSSYSCSKKNLVFKKSRVQDDEWFKMMSGSFVVSGFM